MGCSNLLSALQSLKAPELKERLEESEKLIQEMTVTWEEKLRKTEEIAQVSHWQIQLVDLLSQIRSVGYCVNVVLLGSSEAIGESGYFSSVFRDQSWR